MPPVRSGFLQEQNTWHALLVPWMLLFPGRGTCPAGRMARTSLCQVLGRCVGTPPGARSRRFQPVPARPPGCSPAPCACSRREDRQLWREALGQAEHRADMLSMSQDYPRTPDGNSSWRELCPACKAAGSQTWACERTCRQGMGKPSALERTPALEKGPCPGYPQFLRQGWVPYVSIPASPGCWQCPSPAKEMTGRCSLGTALSGPRTPDVTDLLAPREEAWLHADGLGQLRGCIMPWALGASSSQPWCYPAVSCPVFAHWGPAALWGNSNTWTHGELGWPEGAVPSPAACLPPAPSFCCRRAH